jgi:hypothetical protein
MELKVTEVIPLVTERYPWTHRVGFEDNILPDIVHWIDINNIDGIWVGGSFYTTAKYVTMIAMKWGHR